MATELSDERLAEIRQRVEAATPGPWWFDDAYDSLAKYNRGAYTSLMEAICGGRGELVVPIGFGRMRVAHNFNNVEFIAHAREDIPALLAEVDRLHAALAAAEAREAALVEVVRVVAEATEDWERQANHSWLYFDDALAASNLQEQARALLAATETAEAGEGKE